MSLKKITFAVFLLYFCLTCYTIYLLLIKNRLKVGRVVRRGWSLPDDGEDWNPWGEEFEREHLKQSSHSLHKTQIKFYQNQSLDFGKQFHRPKSENTDHRNVHSIEIWGKAAIGLYLWEHILGGKLESKMDGVWSYGYKKIDNLKLKFRTGPGVITTKAPPDVQNLVLVLNGRSSEKRTFAAMWLNYLPQFRLLENVVLIILGDEKCQNEWLLPYMSVNRGLVNVTFIVYDSPLVDFKNVYQWPLGVATYRGFPKVETRYIDLESSRPYICNFLGTVYPHSSREELLDVIQKQNLSQHCFIRVRHEWQPKETKDTLESYIQSLHLSDLTLSPVGVNTECYRIYEAMSYGSVPVIENVMTPGLCGSVSSGDNSPLRLLKSLNAPVIYVNNWKKELPLLISNEQRMSLAEKIERRVKVLRWYESFKLQMRDELLSVIKNLIAKPKR